MRNVGPTKKLLRIAARVCASGFRFLLAGDFLNCFFKQFTLLFARLALHSSDVQKCKQDCQGGDGKTRHPINNERNLAQRGPENSFTENEHHDRDNQERHASFAMRNVGITFHVINVAFKFLMAEKFLAGISRMGRLKRRQSVLRTPRKSDWLILESVLSYRDAESPYADYQTTGHFS